MEEVHGQVTHATTMLPRCIECPRCGMSPTCSLGHPTCIGGERRSDRWILARFRADDLERARLQPASCELPATGEVAELAERRWQFRQPSQFWWGVHIDHAYLYIFRWGLESDTSVACLPRGPPVRFDGS